MKNIILSVVTAMVLANTVGADEISDLKAQLKILSDRLSAIEAKGNVVISSASAEQRIAALEASNKKQVEQTNALTSELINVQNQTSFTAIDSEKAVQGMSPAASKVYYSKNPLSIGGYGELYYSKYSNDGKASAAEATKESNSEGAYGDTYRFIPYIGYKFSDNIILNSELEFEHGNEVAVEQLYVDFILDSLATVRVGHQLVPMGYVNLYHEPTLFNTVQRPDVEKQLIPSTWHELGLSVYGKTDSFEYQAGVFTALDMNNPELIALGHKADKDWIRKARVGNESDQGIDNPAVVVRLDYNGINGLQVGVSGYTGKAGNAKIAGKPEGQMNMYDIHAMYQLEGFKARALYTESHLSNADSYDAAMPESAKGGYVNLEYNILPIFAQSSQRLPLFFQYENYNMAVSTADGKSFGDTETFTYGVNYFPHDQVVLKAEYLNRKNKNTTDISKYIDEGIYSAGIGFIF